VVTERWQDHLVAWRHRALIWQFARREIVGRYRGSWLGLTWAVAHPLAMLAIYTLVFRNVFQVKWPGAGGAGNLDFALNLFAGVLVYQWASELWARAPRLILEQPNLVTKVVFPLPVLAWAALVATTFQLVVSMAIWLLACLLAGYEATLQWLVLPLALLSLVPWLMGLSWALCSLGVYLRDLQQVTSLVLSGLIFLTPVFYPASALPEWLQPLAHLNPLTVPIEGLRTIVLQGGTLAWDSLLWTTATGMAASALGLALMQRIRSGFADVI
jgi:lipopolysaccharide transport system permease protein